jgi:hypothetical protein
MLLLLKTSSKKSKKSSRKPSRKSYRKHKSKRSHHRSHHKGQFRIQKVPQVFGQLGPALGQSFGPPGQPLPVAVASPAQFAFASPLQPFGSPQKMRGSRKSKKNLKTDIQNILEKVRKVHSNKKVQKYKKLLDECITTNCTGLEDKKEQQSCIKTNCRKELKKYNKRFMKEYNRIE